MRRFLSYSFVLLGFSTLLHAETGTQPEPARGVWPSLKRTWHATVGGAESAAKATSSAVQSVSHSVVGVFLPSTAKDAPKLPLQISVACAPTPLVLKQTQKITVLVKVFNNGKKTQLLEFSSSQRADAVLRDATGQIVSRASTDSSVHADPGLVTVNPGERLEYPLFLPTNGMVVGKIYNLECALVGQAGLTAKMQITPQ